jgi:outer membrane protein TolC
MRLHDWRIEIEPMTTLPVTVVNAALDFQESLTKRPDYQQAKLALKRGDISFRLARNQLLPRVDLVGSYGYNGLDRDRETAQRLVRNEDHRSYGYGVQVTIPLTYTAERGRYRAAKYALRQAETDLQQLEQAIVVAVGNAAANIETTRKRVEATRRARELGEQALEAEQKRLRAGTGNTFFVVQQQELLASLEVAESRAEADHRRALAEYDRQLGITLEKLNIEVTAP